MTNHRASAKARTIKPQVPPSCRRSHEIGHHRLLDLAKKLQHARMQHILDESLRSSFPLRHEIARSPLHGTIRNCTPGRRVASESTTEMTETNHALNAARYNGPRQRQLLENRKLPEGNPFSLLTAHANGRPLHNHLGVGDFHPQIPGWFCPRIDTHA